MKPGGFDNTTGTELFVHSVDVRNVAKSLTQSLDDLRTQARASAEGERILVRYLLSSACASKLLGSCEYTASSRLPSPTVTGQFESLQPSG
jgi:hypothetical protein